MYPKNSIISTILFLLIVINVAIAQPTPIFWPKSSSFCQLDLHKDSFMKSMPFESFSQDTKGIRIKKTKPKSYKITSTTDTKCCWQIKK